MISIMLYFLSFSSVIGVLAGVFSWYSKDKKDRYLDLYKTILYDSRLREIIKYIIILVIFIPYTVFYMSAYFVSFSWVPDVLYKDRHIF